SIIGISLILIYLLLFQNRITGRLINNKTIFLALAFLYITIVFLNDLKMYSFIIENLLQKDLTLSTRKIIWEIAIKMINESLYTGYGYLSDGRYILYYNPIRYRDAHNTILQFMLQHGFLGMIPLI